MLKLCGGFMPFFFGEKLFKFHDLVRLNMEDFVLKKIAG